MEPITRASIWFAGALGAASIGLLLVFESIPELVPVGWALVGLSIFAAGIAAQIAREQSGQGMESRARRSRPNLVATEQYLVNLYVDQPGLIYSHNRDGTQKRLCLIAAFRNDVRRRKNIGPIERVRA